MGGLSIATGRPSSTVSPACNPYTVREIVLDKIQIEMLVQKFKGLISTQATESLYIASNFLVRNDVAKIK